ncbi:hypothetical protein ACO0LM_10470 [Undibacterium sp. Di26W]|uniref:hypothetical protein n=1 Tax=Undibacterium sp. Di26W TaxID=3413035 RepID=UPI003BF014FD
MNLETIAKKYFEKSSEIEITQMIVKGASKEEFDELRRQEDIAKNSPELKFLPSALYVTTYRKLVNGQLMPYGSSQHNVEDLKLNILLRKNKQFCWLLAETYEAFEDFLEEVYAYLGFTNNETWPMSDFGEITLLELPSKDFEWYQSRVEHKKNKPSSILTRLRLLYPELSKIEAKNALGINAKIYLTLIEKLRHIIVHNHGIVTDKTRFIEKVMKDSALFNNGKYDVAHKEFIESHFGTGKYENLILLLEIKINSDAPINSYHDVFNELSGFLLAYAAYIYEIIKNHEIAQNQQLTK